MLRDANHLVQLIYLPNFGGYFVFRLAESEAMYTQNRIAFTPA